MKTTTDRLAPEKWYLSHLPLYSLIENITVRGDMIYNDLPSFDYLHSIFNYNKKTGKLIWKKKTANCVQIGAEAGFRAGHKGRMQVTIKGKAFYVHRIIWKMVTGSIPNDKQIDHEDRNVINNKWSNLLLKTQSENMKNQGMYKNNTSGIVGVNFHKFSGLWMGHIAQNKKKEAKYFKTKMEAINWRKEKEIQYSFHKNHGIN